MEDSKVMNIEFNKVELDERQDEVSSAFAYLDFAKMIQTFMCVFADYKGDDIMNMKVPVSKELYEGLEQALAEHSLEIIGATYEEVHEDALETTGETLLEIIGFYKN